MPNSVDSESRNRMGKMYNAPGYIHFIIPHRRPTVKLLHTIMYLCSRHERRIWSRSPHSNGAWFFCQKTGFFFDLPGAADFFVIFINILCAHAVVVCGFTTEYRVLTHFLLFILTYQKISGNLRNCHKHKFALPHVVRFSHKSVKIFSMCVTCINYEYIINIL